MSKLFWVYLFCSILFFKLVITEDTTTTTEASTLAPTAASSGTTIPPAPTTNPTETTPTDVKSTGPTPTNPVEITTTTPAPTPPITPPTKIPDETPTDPPLTIPDDTTTSASEITVSPTPVTDETTTTPATTITTTPPITPINISAKSFTWSSEDSTQNPIVVTAEGYFISVKVSGVHMSDGNYLLIEGGNSHSPDSTDGRVFANNVAGPLLYLFKTNSVYAFYENTKTDGDNVADFTVEFETYGETTTTVITTTTTPISVPTTEKMDSIYFTVNVSGRALSDYKETKTVEAFQSCVALMATNYCKTQNIILEKKITNEYVMIADAIHQCPYNWPDSSNCARIKFSLPIFYNESSGYKGYQLNSQNLEVMWLRWAELDEQCFSQNSFTVYTEPDINESITWWAVGISLIIAAFIVLLWFLWTFSSRMKAAIKKRNRRRDSDTVSIVTSKKDSLNSLTPHYLQDTPKFFET